MEASQMLDVLHYYFEEDNRYASAEQMQSQSKIREALYEDLYKRTYKYKYVEKDAQGRRKYSSKIEDYPMADDMDLMSPEEANKPFNPKAERPKEEIPITTPMEGPGNPFDGILDAPMGG